MIIENREKGENTMFVKFERLRILNEKEVRVPKTTFIQEVPHESKLDEIWDTMERHIPLIVRSAMGNEDSSSESCAGKYESILGVTTKEELQHAIQEVLDVEEEEKGCMIQPMIRALKSGVMFTSSPFSNEEVIIESSYGLAEPIVSGNITPDHYRIEKQTGVLLEEKLSKHKHYGVFLPEEGKGPGDTLSYVPYDHRYVIGSDGKCIVSFGYEERTSSSVTEEELQMLWAYGKRIETIFEKPQDIEWIIDEEGVCIVQTRDITRKAVETTVTEPMEGEVILTGQGVSSGIASGIVINEKNLTQIPDFPYIVVAKETKPEMVYLLSGAAGIITEIGSMLCHAAIVAREWGIPCIVGAEEALNRLENGKKIKINGESGEIFYE